MLFIAMVVFGCKTGFGRENRATRFWIFMIQTFQKVRQGPVKVPFCAETPIFAMPGQSEMTVCFQFFAKFTETQKLVDTPCRKH